MERIVWAIAILCGIATSQVAGDKEQMAFSKFKSEYFDVGDPRLCMEIDRDSKFDVQRFEVLPGIGWDNLQNVARGQVVDYNYSRCLSTDDGRYLIPDQVFTIPIKESFVDTFAEFIDTWHNTSSTTSSSVNVNAGLHIGFASVSGSYSNEHTQIKKKQIEDKAVTVRVQLRYHRYQSQLQPDPTLHSTFKRRILNIAAFIELNETQMAQYESQLLVRDFGTHFISSVTAGAGLAKTDFLKRDYVATQFEDKTKMLASASASFGSFFGASGSYGHSTDTTDYQSYLKSMTHSFVTSHGGPIMKAYNMSVNDWTKGVDLELVPMDRSGEPLSFLVTQQTLPELPAGLVYDVEKIIRKTIVQYYEKNTIFGCTTMGSPNFSFSANFDDGSCETAATNMTFGGVYQTCSVSGQFVSKNPCDGMSQVNPKTRDYSCPSSYTSVTLVTGKKVGVPEYRRECHSCGLFGLFDCCDNVRYVATAVYTAHWCAGLGAVPQHSGYLFGGVYSSTVENPVSGTKGCPPSFYPRIFLDHQVCISDDFELGTQYSVPFGGFMSCNMGNPLSTPGVHPVGLQAPPPKQGSLQSYMAQNSDSSSWPKQCPKGYSQHLLSIDNGCEIRYCLKSGSLSGPNLPHIKLPPFHDKPNRHGVKETRVMFNIKTQEWFKNAREYNENSDPDARSWSAIWGQSIKSDGSRGEGGTSSLAPGAAAAIAVMVTLSCGVLALVAFKMLQRRRQRNGVRLHDDTQRLTASGDESGESSLTAAAGGGGTNYGAVNGQQNDTTCAIDLPAVA